MIANRYRNSNNFIDQNTGDGILAQKMKKSVYCNLSTV